MSTLNILVAAAAALALIGCATSSGPVDPHQHFRDAKQGAPLPTPVAGSTAQKPLHDHYDFK